MHIKSHDMFVQGEIENALKQRFHRRIPVVGAGRTDSGVHARGQAIHFDLNPDEISFEMPMPPSAEGETVAIMTDDQRTKSYTFCSDLENSLNRMMSLDIRMFQLQLAPYTWVTYESVDSDNDLDETDPTELLRPNNVTHSYCRPWHVIQRAESKWYSYRLALGPTLWNPMERFTRTHFVHRPSFIDTNEYDEPYAITLEDIQRLKSIFKLYEGTHDFGAFGGQLEQNAKKRNDNKPINTIRTVYKAELVKEPNYRFGCYDPFEQQHGFIGEEGNYRIDFLLKGALYKMVRNMVGTAIEVWLGRMTEEQLVELLQIEQDQDQRMDRRDNPCKPAPPEGLTLECVYYDDGF
jgi:tRNA pseudouridine38-40 synthase